MLPFLCGKNTAEEQALCREVQEAVYSAIENTSGLTVECVNVQVSGIVFERERHQRA